MKTSVTAISNHSIKFPIPGVYYFKTPMGASISLCWLSFRLTFFIPKS